MRLVDHARAHLVTVPVRTIGPLIVGGALSLNGSPGRIDDLVHPGDRVTVDLESLASCEFSPQPLDLAVLHEDDDLLVCDKPAGMHVHPLGEHREGTLLNALLWHCGARPHEPWGAWRPCPIHRLDRAVRGLVVVAKGAASHERMRHLLERHAIERRYRAYVRGRVSRDAGTIDAPLGRDPACDYRRAIVPLRDGGQRAVTHYTVTARESDRTELAIVLETGRTHQIRAHLASIGHPVVGDALYETPSAGRAAAAAAIELYATEVRLAHPRDGHELVVRLSLR